LEELLTPAPGVLTALAVIEQAEFGGYEYEKISPSSSSTGSGF
jgi:hypothetical protein